MENADNGLPMPEIAEREKNFFNGEPPSTIEGKLYYTELQLLADNVIANAVNKLREETDNKTEILRTVFAYVYDYVMDRNKAYRILDNIQDAFEACFFMSLCMFLYDTRRIKGMSLRKFLYEHSQMGYNDKESPNYFDFESRSREFRDSKGDKPGVSSDLILGEETKLRQYRKRLLDKRPVYHDSSEWSAIRKVSEHEWTLYLQLGGTDTELHDTEKRIRNLYNDVNKAIACKIDENYISNVDKAAEKFCSKIKKLRYERYLELIKYLFEHIKKDKTCYGINLYRLEKGLKPYRITSDVNELVNCNDDMEADCIIQQAMVMENIVFPKLYKYFANLPNISYTQICANIFWLFMDEAVHASRLIIDKFVEAGTFGKDWEQLFLETTNELAETVLYDPSEINDSIVPKSQQEFEKYLFESVDLRIRQHKKDAEINPSEDD